jgi:hypothetical protein
VITVRRAIPDDIEALSNLFYQGSLEAHNQECPISIEQTNELVKTYFGIGKFINIFFDGDKLVGACCHETIGQLLAMVHLDIHKDFRGLRLSYKILLMDKSFCNGISLVSMVPECNEKVIKSALRAGYSIVGYLPNCWNQGGNIMGRVVLFKE